MDWNECYSRADAPDMQQIADFVASPLWSKLCTHLEDYYKILPKIEHSRCTCAPGWNVKYKKSGRALCTLYPAEGYFHCMVSIGSREATDAELMLADCTETVRKLYLDARPFNGSRWLMIPITSQDILNDAEELIALRMQKHK